MFRFVFMKNIPYLERSLQHKREHSFESDHHNVSLQGMVVHWLNGRCNLYWGRVDTSSPWTTLPMEPEPRPVIPTEQTLVDSQIRK